uniref:SFRICE_017833 n=1 Tax=Spodoptera frugiperda TaxID=7108 RepID=A0A2H1W007_SPOFR
MIWLPIFLVAAVGCVSGQETAQTRVASSLSECYSSPYFLDRNNLPPVTMPVLIDVIRKIEDNTTTLNLREITTLLLHTYRQDGIQFHQPENSVASANVLPFAPTFHSFHRNRLLLTKLLPENRLTLSADTLPSVLKCALHHMLSTTVDTRVRGDESSCSQLSQYRALRTARSGRSISDDVEIMKPSDLRSANKNGKMRQYDPNNDVEFGNMGVGSMSERQVAESTCPLLGGVVDTAWGAVSAGNLIAGIATGAQPQVVNIMQLVRDASPVNYRNVQQTVNSLFPATLSGDLAEAVLIQGTERGSSSISIGTAGGWNSTQARRHFMLQNRINVEMTDPEIRGGIDGFVLGSNVVAQLGIASNMKLSQLLDMYYSPRNGALDPNLRACNRRESLNRFVTNEQLVSETNAFAAALDTNMPLRGTIIGGLDQLVTSAVTNLRSYTNDVLNDLNCDASQSQSNNFRTKTNLYIVLDSSWQYQTVMPAIAYLVDSIEVGKFGSSITLLSAFDGSVVVNTTFSPADFYAEYNALRHTSMTAGISFENSLSNVKLMIQQRVVDESSRNYIGGNSSVLLYLINGNLPISDRAWEQANDINKTLPDLRVLFATTTNQFDSLYSFVRDMYKDIFTVSLNSVGTGVDTAMAPILQRIQSIGRRVVNPACGVSFTGGSSGARTFDDYVEPGYVNYYRISPNYFFGYNENRRIRVSRTSSGIGGLVVCHSRTVEQPRRDNSTVLIEGSENNPITCQTLNTGNVEIGMQNLCDGWDSTSSCPPFYMSVESDTGLAAGGLSSASAACTDPNCRFPYNIRYAIQVDELGCYNGASSLAASFLVLLSALYLTLYGS